MLYISICIETHAYDLYSVSVAHIHQCACHPLFFYPCFVFVFSSPSICKWKHTYIMHTRILMDIHLFDSLSNVCRLLVDTKVKLFRLIVLPDVLYSIIKHFRVDHLLQHKHINTHHRNVYTTHCTHTSIPYWQIYSFHSVCGVCVCVNSFVHIYIYIYIFVATFI